MDNIYLERIGIIMNCIAGFMIAPELIGENRLVRLSEKIQRSTRSVQAFIIGLQKRNWANSENLLIAYLFDINSEQNQSLHSQYTSAHALLLIFSLTFVGITYFICSLYIEEEMTRLYIYLSFYLLGVISFLFFLTARIWRRMRYLATITYLLFELYLGWAVAVFYLFFDILNYILNILVSYVSQQKFRASLVFIGICVYLLGNLFQIAATF